jgi:hypothetical protein
MDYSIMKSFMTSRSLSQGMEVDEADMMPFLREEAVMTIYDECPSPGRRCVPNPSLFREHRNVRAQIFLYINICRNIYICTLYTLQNKREREREMAGRIAWGCSIAGRAEF